MSEAGGGVRGRSRRLVAVAVTAGIVSALAYLALWLDRGTACTGTGAGVYGCQAFECVYGDRLAAVEIVAVGPALVAGMVWVLGRPSGVTVPVWAVGLGWLLAGRFLLYAGLVGRLVRHCVGL